MKLVVQLVTWNGAKYVPYLFASLRWQTYRDWELHILDNGSTDGMVSAMKKELTQFPVPHQLIESKENTGFAGGHNQLYAQGVGEFVLLLNQDMYLLPDCLENMAEFLDAHPEAGVVAPRIMRWDFHRLAAGGLEKSLSDCVDALGINILRNRRAVEQHTQECWNDVRARFGEGRSVAVFGVSGAFPLYRRSVLKAIAFSDGTFFDGSYFMYKEDLDVAYRLQAAGYAAYVLPGTVAYHDRTGAGPKDMNDLAVARNKARQPPHVRYYSYKNHLVTLYKNEFWQNTLLDFPWIFWYEVKKFGYFLLHEPKVLLGLGEILRNRRMIRNKAHEVRAKRKVGWREMRKWWTFDLL